jgi:general secretion pathway protein D
LNRLVPLHGHRFVCFASVLMLAAPNVSAQIQMPVTAPVSPTSVSPTSVSPTFAASKLETGLPSIAEVQSALERKDYHAAILAFRKVAATTSKHPQLAGELAKLRAQFDAIGIDAALLAAPIQPAAKPIQPLTADSVPRLPYMTGAAPIAAANADRKKEALRLVAIGRAALDRGDVKTALSYARQAETLKVPEREFAVGEPRVWQLVLDTESAARLRGIDVTPNTGTALGAVQPAVATAPSGDRDLIAQMLFNAEADGQATAGSVQQVQNTEPIPEGNASPGERAYREGLAALTQGDKVAARQRFVEAWKYEADLHPTVRSQLKDKLTLLQPARLAAQQSRNDNDLTPIRRTELAAQDKARRLFREVTAELADAEKSKTSDPLDALDQLERLRRRVDGSDVDDVSKRSIAMMVSRATADQRKYIDANKAKIQLDLQNDTIRTEMANEQARESSIDEEVSSLVNSFNGLIEERRFHEAEVIAKQVQELKPGDPIAVSMFHTSRMGTRLMMAEDVKSKKELGWLDNLNDVDASAIAMNPNLPMQLPDAKEWEALSRRRLQYAGDGDSRLSPAELVIRKKLSTEVNVKFANRPLGEVLSDLQAMTGVPIVIDDRALGAVRVTTETSVTLQLQNSIPLKSALNIILERLELTYVIENDVLSITSMEAKRSKVYPKTYRVTDLVTPIPNFTSSYEDGLAGALRSAYQMSNPQTDVHVTPISMTDLGTGMARSMSPSNTNVLGQYNPMGAQGGFGASNPPMAGGGGGSFADFQSLIDLIQTTVVPDTWEALGGPSTMAPYPQNLSLVISTTSEVHDQVADLLDSLRRLQNLQITIEVRFITLADAFAEQIGVDFNFSVDDNVSRLPDDDSGPSVTIGWDGIASLPTADLDITFENGSFGLTPPFGAAGLGTPSTIGFAILSDIEAFFFLQAAQSDNRSNVMQAPKVTLFDGQFATISDQTQRPFVTSITPVVGDFAVAQQPVIVVLNEGTQLNVQGIVSDDKRFVRLTLVPFFSQIGAVDTFTFEGRRTTRSNSRDEEDTNGDGKVDDDDASDTDDTEEIVEGTTVQLPTFAFTSVSTTVSVPDGGTILLGGIKRLSEGRVERGVPMLSKIPYISRLFRNTSAGRQASSLMLMVTPRIIIQEEEEVAQTGFDPNR